MLLLKELIDFLLLLRSPAAMRITNLCNTQTLSAAQCAENTPITYHISLSVSVSLTLSLTFPLINTLGSVCVLQIQTRGKMKKERSGSLQLCADSRNIKGCKSVLNVSGADEWGAEMSTEILLGRFHFISHLSIPSKNRLKLFLCWSQAAANEVQS